MSPVRFGIIACSSVARRRFLPALTASQQARLVHVGSLNPVKASEWAREFSGSRSGDYEAVLADPEVEAVYISTPPSLHEEWVRKAVDAGKHVLVEKPAFSSFDSAATLTERCRAAGLFLTEGYSFRWHPQHAVLRSLIEQGRIGQPRFFTAEFTYPRPPEKDIRLDPQLRGGVLGDSAGYPVAAALLQLPGQPTSVFCRVGQDAASGVDDSCSLWLGFADGTSAQMLTAFGVQYRSRYAIIGSRGRVEAERAFSVGPRLETIVTVETDAGTERIPVEPQDQFQLMLEDFATQLRREPGERRPFVPELLRQHAVMDGARRSHREGRSVALSEYQL